VIKYPDSKIAIITGATSGLGKETALALAGMNASIVLPTRNLKKGNLVKKQITDKTGNPDIYVMECDLASFESIRKFAGDYKKRFSRLHILVNNAGIWENKRKETSDGIEVNFGVNHLAHFLLTSLLMDELRKSTQARIVNVSSSAHMIGRMNFSDPEGRKNFSSIRSYGQSKLANILFTRFLADKVRKEGITVNCLHPGVVATNLFDKLHPVIRYFAGLFMISCKKGAETIVYLAASPDVEGVSGEYFVRKKIKKPWSHALDDRAAARLWELSREYTGL
jgi:NAD(P)-dependent dehydrogenase (short-subunit alcohol dehydrogenase family)